MAPSGISLNKPAAIFILVLVAGGIIFYRWKTSSALGEVSVLEDKGRKPAVGGAAVAEGFTVITIGDERLEVFTRSAKTEVAVPAGIALLFLHGQAFTSEVWVTTGTLQTVASWGYDAIAVDLPGYGKTKESKLAETHPEQILAELIQKLSTSPVIVCPSMSGRYALPYLFSEGMQSKRQAQGLVAIAPVQTEKYDSFYPSDSLPTLIVYGEKDEELGKKSEEHLKALKNTQVVKLPKAGHACYVDQPGLFHDALKEFLHELSDAQQN